MEKLTRLLMAPVPRPVLWVLCLIVFGFVAYVGVAAARSNGALGVMTWIAYVTVLLMFAAIVYRAARGLTWIIERMEHVSRMLAAGAPRGFGGGRKRSGETWTRREGPAKTEADLLPTSTSQH